MIEIFYEGEDVLSSEEKENIETALSVAFRLEGLQGPGELSVSFVDSEEIRILNRDYRGKDKSTDVLSFPQEESLEELLAQPYQVLGDVVINMDLFESKLKNSAIACEENLSI